MSDKDQRKSSHGGARIGAGRPIKYDFWKMCEIGQACEALWRKESNLAVKARLSELPHADRITALQEDAQMIPVARRKAWMRSEAYEDHSGDIEAFLHDREGTYFNDETGDYEGDAPRVVTVSTKPPKGTRVRIIGEVATKTSLSKTAVDNLWQAYRRFERELSNSAET